MSEPILLPAYEVRPIPGKGLGVVATAPLPSGGAILAFVGPVVRLEQVEDHARYLQIGPDAFLGSSGGPDDFVNHACEPNAGLVETPSGIELRALRRIDVGEEICFDYASWATGGLWRMRCRCGAPTCRGVVGDFEELPAVRRRRYRALGIVPRFVRARRAP